jgi:hypothetical protein
MKRLFVLLFLFAAPLNAEERVDLTTPHDPDPRATSVLRVNALNMRWGNSPEESLIDIQLSSGTILLSFGYFGQDARNQMILLNKANLTSNSLHRRVLNKLISDGFISGTISGSPD